MSFIPTFRGVYLLNCVETRVEFAWSRGSLFIVDGEQAGTSVALAKGTWEKIDDDTKIAEVKS